MLEPGAPGFDECLKQCFRGFVHTPTPDLPEGLEARVRDHLAHLDARGFFHHDVVLQGGGQKYGRTIVRRLLAGEPGITYKYLGLRIFAHPWTGEGAGATSTLRELNDALTASTRRLLRNSGGAVAARSRCDFNLTLINVLGAAEPRGGALRDKAGARLGQASEQAVSWHADSSLEPYSSIAVLNLTLPSHGGGRPKGAKVGKGGGAPGGGQPWRIAMKCVGAGHEPDGTGRGGTPALAVPLGVSDAYYLLDDFNHHHHHAVLAGSAGRYSSTHRVAVTATDTFQGVWARAKAALALEVPVFGRGKLTASAVRQCEEVHSEIEFEWLRQWGAQGRAHATTHAGYWSKRMAELAEAWASLEARTAAFGAFLEAAAAADAPAALHALPEGVRCFDVYEQQLSKREGEASERKQLGRAGWRARLAAAVYARLPEDERPFACPRFTPGAPAESADPALAGRGLRMPPEELAAAAAATRRHRAAFAQKQALQKRGVSAPGDAFPSGPSGGGAGGAGSGSEQPASDRKGKKRKRPRPGP